MKDTIIEFNNIFILIWIINALSMTILAASMVLLINTPPRWLEIWALCVFYSIIIFGVIAFLINIKSVIRGIKEFLIEH